jgi:hypothetical protein
LQHPLWYPLKFLMLDTYDDLEIWQCVPCLWFGPDYPECNLWNPKANKAFWSEHSSPWRFRSHQFWLANLSWSPDGSTSTVYPFEPLTSAECRWHSKSFPAVP